ncbi:hypothetical protein [Prevotella denticola]|uniref:hypothetical protein n=1 Tax=Prevotella denticola TaxID=28129 RepID=UPI0028E7CCD9|nr:hypothetical protein [Prevotella denticola]
MKQTKKGIVLLCLMMLTIGFSASCSKMDVGYLRTAGASFTPDSINAFHNIDPTSDRAVNNLPFVSTRIQGVAGTNPVNFELAGVKAGSPEQEQLFLKLCREGEISVAGGLVVVSLKAVKQLPNGRYRLSLRVYNEDHEAVLENVFKVVVTDDELPVD